MLAELLDHFKYIVVALISDPLASQFEFVAAEFINNLRTSFNICLSMFAFEWASKPHVPKAFLLLWE